MRSSDPTWRVALRVLVACALPGQLGCAGVQHPCPSDLDRDGYVGSADLCPEVAEDGKGAEPRDGCPLEGPMVVEAPKPEVKPEPAPPPAPRLPPLPVLPRDRVLAEIDGRTLPPCERAPEPVVAAIVDKPAPAPALPPLPRLPREDVVAENERPKPVAEPCPAPVAPRPRPIVVARAKPARVVVSDGEIKLNEKILFDTGLASINPSSDALLENLATAIQENPDIQFIEIAGHADKRGGAFINLDLTKRRSGSVMSRLVSLGVAPARLRSVGYGSYCPVSAEETELAYEQNRRVEFKILRRGGKDLSPNWGGCEQARQSGLAPQPIPSSAPQS